MLFEEPKQLDASIDWFELAAMVQLSVIVPQAGYRAGIAGCLDHQHVERKRS
jgi:hypothetical protein